MLATAIHRTLVELWENFAAIFFANVICYGYAFLILLLTQKLTVVTVQFAAATIVVGSIAFYVGLLACGRLLLAIVDRKVPDAPRHIVKVKRTVIFALIVSCPIAGILSLVWFALFALFGTVVFLIVAVIVIWLSVVAVEFLLWAWIIWASSEETDFLENIRIAIAMTMGAPIYSIVLLIITVLVILLSFLIVPGPAGLLIWGRALLRSYEVKQGLRPTDYGWSADSLSVQSLLFPWKR